MIDSNLIETVRRNCDISDARDNGIYSICTLVLKLRNRYKWEKGIEPWQEPEPGELLDWIEARENYWEAIAAEEYAFLTTGEVRADPWDIETVNAVLADSGLIYGAGYGRSMKAIFFLAEMLHQESVDGCPVLLLGREWATELARPFAMLQGEQIIIRRAPLRYFFWDHIMDLRASCRSPIMHALQQHGVADNGDPVPERIAAGLERIVDAEIPIFIRHEIGELRESILDSATLKVIISRFPHSAIEFVGRTLKDILADTHPDGMIPFIISEKREASLAFYVGFLDGVRKLLFPEITPAFARFLVERDWQAIEKARRACRNRLQHLAERMRTIVARIDQVPLAETEKLLHNDILVPLGLDLPEK